MNSPHVKPLAGYKLAVMLKKLKDELEAYEERRMAACKRYGKLEPVKNQFVFESEALQNECARTISELQEAELQVVIPQFAFEELFSNDATLRPADLVPLIDVILVS